MASILMVCLGNICRSPMAEAAMRLAAEDANIEAYVDSAGTVAWHIGKQPDQRGQMVVRDKANIDMSGYKARQVQKDDFDEFDYIFAMDEQNFIDLKKLQPSSSKAELSLLLDHNMSVADPYYGDISDFETVWEQVNQASVRIVKDLTTNIDKRAKIIDN